MSDCSTHAFDVPLKSCPFCGGEAEYGLTFAGEEVYCKECHAAMPRISTKEKTIEAWNTRYEQTCRAIQAKSLIACTCSECGTMLANWCMNRCPNCGAKVVGE